MDVVVLARLSAPVLLAAGRAVKPAVSVVVPVYNGAATLSDCLRSLQHQNLPRSSYEIVVVDDGSTDETATIAAAFDVRVVGQRNAGAAAARNAGCAVASADWIAFTDADCVASRGWLKALLRAAVSGGDDVIGVAGKTVGLASTTAAARFVDATGGYDAARHLSHPRYPFAPSGNVLYRRAALEAVDGYDARYRSYEACDLHQRLAARGGRCVIEPAALVFHRHRATWRDYWRQQRSYGAGLAQFMRARKSDIRWSLVDELRAWSAVLRTAVRAVIPGSERATLVRRGTLVKSLAQRVGFVAEYWHFQRPTKLRLMLRYPGILSRAIRTPSDALLLLQIGAFIVRLPESVRTTNVTMLLRTVGNARRPKASTVESACARIARLRDACLTLPRLRRRNTCYVKALTLYRFVDAGGRDVRLHFGIEQPPTHTERLRSHAWITVDGRPFEAPAAVHEARIREMPLSRAK